MTQDNKREKPRYYWDACVFLSAIDEIDGRVHIIRSLMADAERGDIEIITSTLSIVEVAHAKAEKTGRALDSDVERRIDQLWISPTPVRLVDVHQLIARQARALMRDGITKGWSLKPADAVHLSTARSLKSIEFHTYDSSLEKYKAMTGIKVCEPYTDALPFNDLV